MGDLKWLRDMKFEGMMIGSKWILRRGLDGGG